MAQLTKAEIFENIKKALEADERGDHEEAFRIRLKIPLAPHLAMAYKDTLGKEALIESGFDLSEAEAEYGSEWLDR